MTKPEFAELQPEDGAGQNPKASARARRRRAHRMVIPQDAQGQSALLGSLTRRAYPSYDLFIFAILSGAVLGLGYLLDSQAVLLLGILIAPLLTPWAGMLIGLLLGSLRYVFETFMAVLISAVLVFLSGLMTGFAARLFLPRTFNSAFFHSRLWIPELIALTLGAVLLIVSFVRSESKPYLPSVVLAYGFYLPASASGFGLGSGVAGLWPQAGLVLAAHFSLASLAGLLTLFAFKFKPPLGGMLLSGAALFALAAILIIVMIPGTGFALAGPGSTANTNALPTATLQLVAAPPIEPGSVATPSAASETFTPTAEPSPTPVPLTLLVTLPLSETATVTLTFEPTPVMARVVVSRGGGAILYERPAGNGFTVLDNYSIVEVLPDTLDVSGTIWAHVIANQNGNLREGWLVQNYLIYDTPMPDWQPSPTITFTPSP